VTTAAPAQIEGVEHRYAELPDFRVHYAEAGDPSGDPVLLLHGWPQHWYEWHRVIPPLAAAGYRVIAPDLRGFGWSGAPDGPYSPEIFARDQVALLDALEIETAKVAGHDWGGYTSVLLAALDGERFERAVCFNAPHLWPNVTPSVFLESWRIWYVLVNATGLTAPLMAWSGRWIASHGHGVDPFTPEEVRLYTEQFATPDGARTTERLYRDYLRRFLRAGRGKAPAERLQAPTLIVFGEDDLYVSPKLAEPPRDDRGPLEVEFVPGAGHFIVNERPELAAEKILDHFQKEAGK